MTEYALFFDQQEVAPYSQSAEDAVRTCYGFLHNISADYLEKDPTECERRTWLLTYDPEQKIELRSNKHRGKAILEACGQLTIYLQSNYDGTLAVAGISTPDKIDNYEHYRSDQSREDAVDELKTQLRHTGQSLKEHIKSIKRLPSPENMPSWDEEVCPLQILEAAQDRIFAHNLHHALQECSRTISSIERDARLANGSIYDILHSIRPMRPTQDMVDAIAKAIGVQPYHLWYDAVGPYNKTMWMRPNPIKSETALIDLDSVEEVAPFIQEE